MARYVEAIGHDRDFRGAPDVKTKSFEMTRATTLPVSFVATMIASAQPMLAVCRQFSKVIRAGIAFYLFITNLALAPRGVNGSKESD